MYHRICLLFLLGCTMLTTTPLIAQETAAPSSERSRASLKFFQDLAETRSYTLGAPMSAKVTPDGKTVLFLQSEPRNPVLRLYAQDVATGKVEELLTPEAILKGTEEQLSPEERARRERMRVNLRGFTRYSLSKDGQRLMVGLSGKLYVVQLTDKHVTALPGEGWIDPRFSPDGKYVSAVSKGELFVIDLSTLTARQLTSGATEQLTHGLAEFVAQEEMGRFQGYWWSPDSTRLLYQQTDLSPVERLHIPDLLHPEQAPEVHAYPRAGTPNAVVKLGAVPVTGGQTTWISWDSETFPYLARVTWDEKNAPPTLLVQNRVQQAQVLLKADVATGKTLELLKETDDAWLNLDNGFPRWLPDGKSFIWSTERQGDWQLELRDATGKFVRAITTLEFGYEALLHLDAKKGEIIVSGGADPTQSHLFRLKLKGGKPQQLTEGIGYHTASHTDNTELYVHSYTLLSGEYGVEVKDAAGKVRCTLPFKAEKPPFQPNLEITRIQSSERTYDAALLRPRDFKAGQKYPVILSVYAGPGVKTVMAAPKSFLRNQWLADHGYIVVTLDGRGTPGHGRAWERAIRGDLIEIPLHDQVDGLQALGGRYPELDLDRVAVTGWSFGGFFTAMALLRRPDVFKVGASGAPVTEWRDYDTHYTERYLGLPQDNPDAYNRSSALTYARDLKRPMLLIHGLADDNVYFIHTLKLSNALFKAGIPFDLIPLPGTHMLYEPAETLSLWTRMLDYFNVGLGLPPVYQPTR